MSTAYHAKYFAHELTKQGPASAADRLSRSLFDACVDLNPHQIEAAHFALRSPLSKGVILADEVGLGKTIEAGLLLCQYWAERKRRLLVICPASLRKQWAMELQDKFNLPVTVLDKKLFNQIRKSGNPNPFDAREIVVTSFNFAAKMKDEVRIVGWNLVVIDEAHKLRNAYQESNKTGRAIRWAVEDRKKVLLTATPLQNSLMELYGLSTLIDGRIFGEPQTFRSMYAGSDGDLDQLKRRLQPFCKRTLRRQVLEYIQYTKRKAITQPFDPTDSEQKFYEDISAFLQREDVYALPKNQRQLTTLILRKLLASSSKAIEGTLRTMKSRLERMLAGENPSIVELVDEILDDEDLDEDEIEEEMETLEAEEIPAPPDGTAVDPVRLAAEIEELGGYARRAGAFSVDTKTRALLTALETGFQELKKMGAAQKALIFTESRRTQDYLKKFLDSNGYAGRIVLFNGSNSDPESKQIYEDWVRNNAETGRVTGSKPVDSRMALVEHFEKSASIMIATEAAAEGVNLQFCSLVVNYDLPWNPQRIEQRIGRCHRYGQKFDVVVINFLNTRNEADQRVYELLNEKFSLFEGVFGSSDEVLGTVESGVDFEKRVLEIYQQCRSPEQITAAFRKLRSEMDAAIQTRMKQTRQMLLEFFDEDVHARLKAQLDNTRIQLDRFGKMFWQVTKHMLGEKAEFDEQALAFDLKEPPPADSIKAGRYHLISKDQQNVPGEFLYRLAHPLGEWVLDGAAKLDTPVASLEFRASGLKPRVVLAEAMKGRSGWMSLDRLAVDSFGREEYLLFTAFDDTGEPVDQETCERLFSCPAAVTQPVTVPGQDSDRLKMEVSQHIQAALARSAEANGRLYDEERDRLERWAEDMVAAVEKRLEDIKSQIKVLKREERQAPSTAEKLEIQKRINALETSLRRQRQEIFDAEDEIGRKRDELIGKIEQQMAQKSETKHLFTVRWSVV